MLEGIEFTKSYFDKRHASRNNRFTLLRSTALRNFFLDTLNPV